MANTEHLRTLGAPVKEEDIGVRIDRYLAKNFLFLSRSGWQKRIKKGEIYIDQNVARHHQTLKEGSQISMYYPPENEPDVQTHCDILYQDDDIAVLNKPSGLAMHCHGAYFKNTVHEFLQTKFGPSWSAVHRLDVETSGVLITAGTFEARQHLSLQFQNNQIQKKYAAVVFNPHDQIKWRNHQPQANLVNSKIRIKRWVDPKGLPCSTKFTMLRKSNYGLVLAEPKTGRTNQIRIHLAADGMHLVGDKLYHPNEDIFCDYQDHGFTQKTEEAVVSTRLMLHAWQITFTHPTTKEIMRLHCPLPESFKSIIKKS